MAFDNGRYVRALHKEGVDSVMMSIYKKTAPLLLRTEVGFVLTMLCAVVVAAILIFVVAIWCWNVSLFNGDCGENETRGPDRHRIALVTRGDWTVSRDEMSDYRIWPAAS
jgi:hypothetical protein